MKSFTKTYSEIWGSSSAFISLKQFPSLKPKILLHFKKCSKPTQCASLENPCSNAWAWRSRRSVSALVVWLNQSRCFSKRTLRILMTRWTLWTFISTFTNSVSRDCKHYLTQSQWLWSSPTTFRRVHRSASVAHQLWWSTNSHTTKLKKCSWRVTAWVMSCKESSSLKRCSTTSCQLRNRRIPTQCRILAALSEVIAECTSCATGKSRLIRYKTY